MPVFEKKRTPTNKMMHEKMAIPHQSAPNSWLQIGAETTISLKSESQGRVALNYILIQGHQAAGRFTASGNEIRTGS